MISFNDASQHTQQAISPLDAQHVDLLQANGRVLADDLFALVDSPSLDASSKDGYAVRSADVAAATSQNPVRLRLIGALAAGESWDGQVLPATAVRILTGAPIPSGAQAVVSDEFADDDGKTVTARKHAAPGRNVLPQGCDVALGQRLLAAGAVLRPTTLGLLAAAGHARIAVIKCPRVAIIATGDEIVAPGRPLQSGWLYASNLVTLAAWCIHYAMDVTTCVVGDDEASLRAKLQESIACHDAILTSGGAWKGERDLIVRMLDQLGWEKIYHRVRMGPGKAVGMGLYEGKPVFCLPGGPPSNHMAFLQLALPGLQKLAGYGRLGLPRLVARLAEPVRGQRDWTQFIHGRLENPGDDVPVFYPIRIKSRLQEMARTDGIVTIPEGVASLPRGTMTTVQVLSGMGA